MTIINRWSDHIDSPDNNPIYVGNPSNEVWTTREERRIRVGDMTDAHVRNCYKMVMGTRSEYWQNVFKMEMDKRGLKCDGMKIYQLHKYGGEYEDFRDDIIGTYLRKERAEEEMAKAQDEETKAQLLAKQCADCPYHENMEDNKTLADLMRAHCDHSDIQCDEDGELFCNNYYYHWVDSSFNIEEVEVIE